jgi:hypothetical protein
VVVRFQCAEEWLEVVHANFDACATTYAACATDAITDGGTDSLANGSTDRFTDGCTNCYADSITDRFPNISTDKCANCGTNDGDPSNARSSAYVGCHSRSVYARWQLCSERKLSAELRCTPEVHGGDRRGELSTDRRGEF